MKVLSLRDDCLKGLIKRFLLYLAYRLRSDAGINKVCFTKGKRLITLSTINYDLKRGPFRPFLPVEETMHVLGLSH